jgi:hypothetical protein
MLDTPTGTLLLTAMDIVGPLLLLAALIYGTDARPGSRES